MATQKPTIALFGALLFAPLCSHGMALLDVYEQALTQEPQLQSADAARLAAGELRRQGKAALLPQLDLSASASESNQEILGAPSGSIYSSRVGDNSSYSSQGYTLSLRQPLYNGQALAALHQLDAKAQQAEYEYQTARQSLMVRVTQAYLEVLAAEDELAFARAEQRAVKRQLEQIKQRFKAGLVATTDVQEAQARYDLTVAQTLAADNALAIQGEALAEIIGTVVEKNLSPLQDNTPLIPPDPQTMESWVETALDQNPQLAASRLALDAARQNEKQQRAAHHPSFDIVASYSYTDTGGAFGRETEDNAVGLEFKLPLYHGGGINAQVRESRHRRDQTQAALEQQRRAVVRQTREAYLGVLSSISRVKALHQAQTSSQTALDATRAGLKVGTRTTVDVLNAQRELFRAKRDYARARYDYLINTLRLRQAVGTLSRADLEQLNRWLK